MKITDVGFLYLLIFVLCIILFECCAQYCLKKYSKCNSMLWFLLGYALYGFILILLVISFRYEKIALVNIMWGSISACLLSLSAYYFYGEELTWMQIAGILVILIGTWMIHS